MEILVRPDGKPYSNKGSANFAAKQKKLGNYQVVSLDDGGFGIELEDDQTKQGTNPPTEIEVKPVIANPVADLMPPIIKHKVTRPWKPARVLDIPQHLKDPNFVYRWGNKHKLGNIQKKVREGWIIDKELSAKLSLESTVQDGTPLDGTVQMRELIVLKMPKELAESRKAYFDSRIMDPQKLREKLDADINKVGSVTYGAITIS